MENPGYIALSRQMVLGQQMDLVANNLANMNTPAFKGEDMLFVEYLKRTESGEALSFVQDLALVRDLSPGVMTSTANPLDLAIRGEGYFSVETPAGVRYTRSGAFTLDADRRIVTQSGFPLLGRGDAPLTVPPDAGEVTVAKDGTLSTALGPLGRIKLVTFQDQQGLRKTSESLYDAGAQDPEPVDRPEIHQGVIEGSNVKGVFEMSRMIQIVRSYQAAARVVDEEHRRQRTAIEQLVSARG